jgi:hypothetical protein
MVFQLGRCGVGETVAFSPDSEFRLNFGDADTKPTFDLGNGLGLSEVTGLIEMLQVGAQFVEKLAGKAETHRKSILSQNRCKSGVISLASHCGEAPPPFLGFGNRMDRGD